MTGQAGEEQTFSTLLARLPGPPTDLTTDYGRWQAYRFAAADPTTHPALLQLATLEPDRALATSLVLHMLEELDLAAHPGWLAALAPTERVFATQRSQDLGVLRRAPTLTAADVEAEHPNWTNWLQVRLAPVLAPPARAVLATNGRTKRIRRLAS